MKFSKGGRPSSLPKPPLGFDCKGVYRNKSMRTTPPLGAP